MKSLSWIITGALVACAAAGGGCGSGVSAETSAGAGGGTTVTSGGSTSGSTGTSTTITTGTAGGGANSGDCDDDGDCPGATCVEVTPGGFRVCKAPVIEATTCSAPEFDECCNTSDCPVAGTLCLATPLTPYCGGPAPLENNVCASDFCQTNGDCGDDGAICAPVGTMGNEVRACVAAVCERDGDCTAAPGGICAPVTDACCNAPMGLFCVYPGGCRSSADCGTGHCAVQADGSTSCEQGSPPCPA